MIARLWAAGPFSRPGLARQCWLDISVCVCVVGGHMYVGIGDNGFYMEAKQFIR